MRPAELLRYTVLAVQREGNRRLGAALVELGLTTAQAEVVRVLSQHRELTLAGLGELLICESGGSPSRLVDRLVIGGYVARAPGASDRRQVILSLTARGAEVSDRIATIERQLYDHIEAVMPESVAQTISENLRPLLAGTPADAALERRRA